MYKSTLGEVICWFLNAYLVLIQKVVVSGTISSNSAEKDLFVIDSQAERS